MRITLLLDTMADACPHRRAVTEGDLELDFDGLRAAAWRASAFLDGRGAERVVYLGANGIALAVALFGASYLGVAFAPLNYRLPDLDLHKLLARTAPSVVIVDDEMLERARGVDGVTPVARSAFLQAVLSGQAAPRTDEPDSDIAVLLFTSGTTGEPKAAVLRHHHLTAYVLSSVEMMGADESEAALVSTPPYHIAGISAALTGVFSGRRIVYLPTFSADGWVETAERENCTHAMLVPTMLGRILDEAARRGSGLASLKALSYGGGPMPEPVIERALKQLPHVDFVNAYGLTETSSTISVLGPEDHRAALASDDPAVRHRLASVGRPLPAIELEIRDEHGAPAPRGTHGEVWVRGDQVAGEYLHGKVIRMDGWFPTNDGGWLDEDGYLFVTGRLDDIIVRGGENISPGEIEDVLRMHENVADVAVLGLPDVQWGEKVAAVIVPRAGQSDTEDLAAFVRARLRSTKAPEAWSFRDALPYNETGKLLRRALREELAPGKKR